MPSQKLMFALFSFTIIGAGLYVNPHILGIDLYNFLTDLKRPSLACNSPELLQEFQDRFAHEIEVWKKAQETYMAQSQNSRAREDAKSTLKVLDRMVLHVQKTVTLGIVGNQLACQMTYDYGHDPEHPATYSFMLGRDDDGHLTWQSVQRGAEPYIIDRL